MPLNIVITLLSDVAYIMSSGINLMVARLLKKILQQGA